MNKRPFLMGLGIGLILGAMLLQLMIAGQQQKDKLTSREQDGQSGTAVMPTYTQEELDKRIAEERERVTKELQDRNANQDKAAKSPAADAPPASKPEASQAVPQADKSAAGSGKTGQTAEQGGTKTEPASKRIIVRIEPGSSVTEVAELLADKGIISNKKAFTNLMRTTKIRAGYFPFEGNMTVNEVKKIITSKPLSPELAKKEMSP
ncbi:endolytic transglycosylase MltG [Paenibacillus spongiae]|uniref:Endolytic transglycosylase MltG n=1 Tax=Paenibacillus spongiae TaxID=2909671 RepID=A0ABY5SEW4_9BACL|nr:endolytic transglycosylase MltG [Paenibacillus spongiae]UVI32527.1 endolytic transglycosylase MltG [Paenibacillus spongiae]